MNPVIQEEETGCGIAAVAALAGVTYAESRARANALGIFAEDQTLYSDTKHVRRLLREFGIRVGPSEAPFTTWSALPDRALLAIKYHTENLRHSWHWVVFHRTAEGPKVLDSAAYLESNERTDLEHIHPKWYILVYEHHLNGLSDPPGGDTDTCKA